MSHLSEPEVARAEELRVGALRVAPSTTVQPYGMTVRRSDPVLLCERRSARAELRDTGFQSADRSGSSALCNLPAAERLLLGSAELPYTRVVPAGAGSVLDSAVIEEPVEVDDEPDAVYGERGLSRPREPPKVLKSLALARCSAIKREKPAGCISSRELLP